MTRSFAVGCDRVENYDPVLLNQKVEGDTSLATTSARLFADTAASGAILTFLQGEKGADIVEQLAALLTFKEAD